MGVSWTKEQEQVIRLRNRNILVSAAAGSGKTAVLVERIITRLTVDEPPIDVDQMLVVTFTEAAAAEMKERIRDAIEKKLEEQPDNVHLQRQATLIHNAQVTTIHSFCLSVIRDYFHTIDLDPGFRIADEGELKLLRKDVLEEVLERCYGEASEEFLECVESISSGCMNFPGAIRSRRSGSGNVWKGIGSIRWKHLKLLRELFMQRKVCKSRWRNFWRFWKKESASVRSRTVRTCIWMRWRQTGQRLRNWQSRQRCRECTSCLQI